MRLLQFDNFSVVLKYNHGDHTWEVDKVFRHIPGRTEAEAGSVGHLPWSARIAIAEYCNETMP
jgi:hypothetical protein